MKIVIPSIPPSLNQFAGRKNCWEYRQQKQDWIRMVRAYCKKSRAPYAKARVTITYFFPTQARHDPDNYAGKMILDGLTDAGVIADDSFDCIRLELSGGYDKKNPRTEIEVDPVNEM